MTSPLPRTQRLPGDFVIGCGQPSEGVVSGRVCAGTGTDLSCQLCPQAPNYWRNPPTLTSEGA